MSAGREIKDFVAAFGSGMKLAQESRRNDIYEKAYNAKDASSWKPEDEDKYQSQWGTASGNTVGAGRGSGGWLGRQIKGLFRAPVGAVPMQSSAAPAVAGQTTAPNYSPDYVASAPDEQVRQDAASDGTTDGAAGSADEPVPSAASGGAIEDQVTSGEADQRRQEQDAADERARAAYRKYMTGGKATINPPSAGYDDRTVKTRLAFKSGGAVPMRHFADGGPNPGVWEDQPVAPAAPPIAMADPVGNLPPPNPNAPPAAPAGPTPAQEVASDVEAEKAAPAGGASRTAVTPVGKRKALTDQTRTEAFDENKDRDDPDNVLGQAIKGGMNYAAWAFHLHGDGATGAVGPDPNQAKGQAAFASGVGAAPNDAVHALNQVVMDHTPAPPPGVPQAGIMAIRRLQIVYERLSEAGETEKANKIAFELLQRSAMEAAKGGQQATYLARNGNIDGARAKIVETYNNDVPDGMHAVLGPDGKTAMVRDARGRPVQTMDLSDPQTVLKYALGLSDKTAYWQLLNQRASMVPGVAKDSSAGERSQLNAARIANLNARTQKVMQGPKGKVVAGVDPGVEKINAALDEINSRRVPSPNVPSPAATTRPQGDGEDLPTKEAPTEAPPVDGDPDAVNESDADHGANADPTAKDAVVLSPAEQALANKTYPAGQVPAGRTAAAPAVVAPKPKVAQGTKLPDADEAKYQAWVAEKTKTDGHSPESDDYDSRGYFQSGDAQAGNGHYPDTFKLPNHVTFSNQSKYATKDNPGGSWSEEGGHDVFTPSIANVRNAGGWDNLKKYFADKEPGVELRSPELHTPAESQELVKSMINDDPDKVPDLIVHNGKVAIGAQKEPVPEFDQPHPLAPFGGVNPYNKILGMAVTPGTVKVKSRIIGERNALNKDVADWQKAKADHVKNWNLEQDKIQKDRVAEAKAVYDKPFTPDQAMKFDNEATQLVEEQRKEAVSKKSTGVLADERVQPDRIIEMTRMIARSNPDYNTPKSSMGLFKELTRAGDSPGEEKERAWTAIGKDPAKNVVVRLKSNPDVELHLKRDTYNQLNTMVRDRWKQNVEEKKKNEEQGSYGDRVKSGAVNLLKWGKDAASYAVRDPASEEARKSGSLSGDAFNATVIAPARGIQTMREKLDERPPSYPGQKSAVARRAEAPGTTFSPEKPASSSWLPEYLKNNVSPAVTSALQSTFGAVPPSVQPQQKSAIQRRQP